VIQEDKLIEGAQEGDQGAFYLLARSYQRRIYALAPQYSRHPHEAGDLSQEVWLKAYRAIGGLRRRGGLLYLAAPDHGQHLSQPST
jgi:RNA polymerase sigma-70 factor, ECF subfamily